MVVLKLILDVMEKFRKIKGTQAVIGEATRPSMKLTIDVLELMMKSKKRS